MERIASQHSKKRLPGWQALVMAALLGISGAGHTIGEPATDERGLRQSLGLFDNLLHHSSIVKKVEAVQHPEASSYLQAARRLYHDALAKLDAGELDAAKRARDESLRLLMMAGRMASKAAGEPQLQRKMDYETRLRSVESLLSAHRHITEEKGNTQAEEQLSAAVTGWLGESVQQAQAGKYDEALTSLNKVYALVTTSIQAQRSGETLVRSLDFATPSEEYDYELARYQNYLMLANMLREERLAGQLNERQTRFLDEAHGLYQQADMQARQGQFEQGVASLTQASARLVSFIRASGIYIPGQ